MRPRTLDEVVGQEHLLGPGQACCARRSRRRAALDDPVGAARLGQDHARLADGARGRRPLRRVLRGAVRREGDPPGRRRGGGRAHARAAAHDPVRRRDPPLQPRAAGRVPAPRRGRHDRPRSAPPPRTRRSRSTRRCSRAAASTCCAALERGRPGHASCGARSPIASAASARPAPRSSDDALRARSRALANGDARTALNILELAVQLAPPTAGAARHRGERSARRRSGKTLLYDKAGEEHYNLISALHKSLRDSDPDAALYWMTRMLDAGEDPLYVARRLVRFASEDVGNADPRALDAHARGQGRVRLPRLAGGRAGARAGHALPGAGAEVERRVRGVQRGAGRTCSERPAEPVPLHIRNAPTGS